LRLAQILLKDRLGPNINMRNEDLPPHLRDRIRIEQPAVQPLEAPVAPAEPPPLRNEANTPPPPAEPYLRKNS